MASDWMKNLVAEPESIVSMSFGSRRAAVRPSHMVSAFHSATMARWRVSELPKSLAREATRSDTATMRLRVL
jgi:hypothetical protein